MNIGAISSSMASANIQSQFGMKMLAKELNVDKEMGNEIVNMIDKASMERSVNPNIGSNFDVSL